MKRPFPVYLLPVLAGALLPAPVQARFAATSEPVPVERLVQNVGRYVKEHPRDARAHYTLGRIHSLAFAQDAPEVTVVARHPSTKEALDLPGFAPYESIQVKRVAKGDLSQAAAGHLRASLAEYMEATRLAPKEGLYWMGLGWMLEQGAPFAGQTQLPGARTASGRVGKAEWQAQAVEAYRKAYDLTREEDLKETNFGPRADPSIALEAGEGLLRLLGDRPALAEEMAQIRDVVRKLYGKPRAVTPILFSLTENGPLENLLDPTRTVRFDLAGAGRKERWPWVKPDTCILVWDPQHTGQIRSGRQLFGSATWSMFWSDGYQPLAALDDDGDGFLTGKELEGLGVWQDRNGNGVADRGEVRRLSEFKVRAFAVRQRYDVGGGIVMLGTMLREGGGWFTTHDWIPTSLPRPRGK